ncbi:MAG TPA: U32 family peptidase [Lachnospiraceae bacterium]|nr:U32 family peptidase [Lachnospiraceae bacterium]
MKNKVELLSPAGNYESFLGAIHAGADAVYLGGNKFGARAFADNFTEEELCNAINYAHLFERKVYLTVNTLLKDSEMNELFSYMEPYYKIGLDGVIIQDMGVFQYIKKHFPSLELHVSTQMSITGTLGARMLKELGAKRIVPARELSLKEIKEIKDQVHVEMETFIHGAMCYSYSGQCLFSSMLGGRSGNRGKCAQPCRLPYKATVCDGSLGRCNNDFSTCNNGATNTYEKDTSYILSLKDLCTVSMIPELINAGIDSFKIEGRMKKPEYVAGVTAIYRKYIDIFIQSPHSNPKIADSDLKLLEQLYIRNELSDGYYKKHNGSEMITFEDPSYAKINDNLLETIREKYLDKKLSIKINGTIILQKNKEVSLTVYTDHNSITVTGNMVEESKNRPIETEQVRKQVLKTGNTCFQFEHLDIIMDQNVFISLKELNEIRRKVLEQYECLLLEKSYRNDAIIPKELFSYNKNLKEVTCNHNKKRVMKLSASVENLSQLDGLMNNTYIESIYISFGCFFPLVEVETKVKGLFRKKELEHKSVYLALPYILRNNNVSQLEPFIPLLKQGKTFKGVLIRNLEQYQWLIENQINCEIILDSNIYIWNQESKFFWQDKTNLNTTPVELNYHDYERLGIAKMELSIYGRIPLMITANCIKKSCNFSSKGHAFITDRYKKEFQVITNCHFCYNIIYNSVPLSLHQQQKEIYQLNPVSLRMNFITESQEETKEITDFFINRFIHDREDILMPFKEYTNGHFKRGAL